MSGTGDRGPGTVSSGIYRPPQVIPVYPPGGDTRFIFIFWLGLALYNIVVRIMVRVDVRVRVTQG